MTEKHTFTSEDTEKIIKYYSEGKSLKSIGTIFLLNKITIRKELERNAIKIRLSRISKDSKGQFKKKHKLWTSNNTEDGWIDAHGRFWVYLPTHRKATKTGYVKRSWVHYEFYNNYQIPDGYDVHHKNTNRLDDNPINLELKEHAEHSRFHRLAEGKK